MADKKSIINALPIGKENAIKMKDLEVKVGNPTKGTNNDITRNDIKKLIMEDKVPIGTCPGGDHAGVWMIDSDEELKEVVERNEAIIKDYQEKNKALKEGWEARKAAKK